MKKIFLTLMLLVIGCMVYGSDFVVTHRTPNGEVVSRVVEDETGDFSQTAMRPKAPVFKEGDEPEWITLHIKFEYPENLIPDYVSYSQVGYGYYTLYNGEDEVELVIGKGTFKHNILCSSFVSTDPLANPDDQYLVFLQIPEFTDGMEIIVDAHTICESYNFEFLNNEGNPFRIKHQLYDSNTGQVEIDSDGDIDELAGEFSIYHSNGYEIWWQMFQLINCSYTDGKSRINLDIPVIHTNQLPENLAIVTGGIGVNGNNEIWMIKTEPADVGGLYTNDSKKYTTQNFNMCNTPYMYNEDILTHYLLCTAFNGYISSTIDVWFNIGEICEEISTNILMCFPEASMQGISTVQCLGGLGTTDTFSDPNTSISSQLFLQKNGEVIYQPLNITFGSNKNASFDIYTFGNWEDNNFNKMVNPFIPSDVNKYKGIIGNNTPSLTSLGLWNNEYGSLPTELADMLMDIGILGFGYTGRNGESMGVDVLNASVETEKEGSLVKYIIYNDNVLIDGKVPGFNNTVLGCMIEADDWVPPTLQTLMFMNKEGDVTDRFQSAEEASIMFYAGDFVYTYNEDDTEFMMVAWPLGDIKVEYAPYGSDDFATLTVNEVPDKFFMPGYGYCYEGSLESVDRQSENGWFDLRISLTDENGNYQTQVISPAFKIDSLSGVENVSDMRESLQIVDGRIVSNSGNAVSVYNIDGREVRNDNLAPGIYVARIGAMSQKIIVR
ncbi:MAG: hypothetical protein HDR88_02350 [Bacteroides sp.]|nr:hypothetical protein [Bacteroides sp.]